MAVPEAAVKSAPDAADPPPFLARVKKTPRLFFRSLSYAARNGCSTPLLSTIDPAIEIEASLLVTSRARKLPEPAIETRAFVALLELRKR